MRPFGMTFSSAAALAWVAVLIVLPAPASAASGTIDCAPEAIAAMSPGLRKRAEKVCPHQAQMRKQDAAKAEARQEWFEKHAKGRAAMEKVFRANNGLRPSRVEDLGQRIVWSYHSKASGALLGQCKEYVFINGGSKLLSNRSFACDI